MSHRTLRDLSGYSPNFVTDVIDEIARTCPDAPAIECSEGTLTFQQLNSLSTCLASNLSAQGFDSGAIIGLSALRPADLPVAMLGVLKCGSVCMIVNPIDARPLHQADIDQCDAVLANNQLLGNYEPTVARPKHISFEALVAGTTSNQSKHLSKVTPDTLALLLRGPDLTSYEVVSRRALIDRLHQIDLRLGNVKDVVVYFVAGLSGAGPGYEYLWALSRGYTVCLDAGRINGRRPEKRNMEFSLFYFASGGQGSGSNKYRLLTEGAKFADVSGFSAVWTPERHFHQFGGLYPNPAITGSAIASVTNRIQIRAGSVVLPLHDPIRVAEEWSMVDNLSNGRAAISIAGGWNANDFALSPDSYANRRSIMLERLNIIQTLWSGETISRVNGVGECVDVKLYPHPVQPTLPVWMTVGSNPDSYRLAGQLGLSLLTHLQGQDYTGLESRVRLYRDAWKEYGHGHGNGHVSLMVHAFVDPDRDRVREHVRAPFLDYLDSSADLASSVVAGIIDAGQTDRDDAKAIVEYAVERYLERFGLFGTVEDCVESVQRISTCGVDELACLIDFGIDEDIVLGNLKHLKTLRDVFQTSTQTGLYNVNKSDVTLVRYLGQQPEELANLTKELGYSNIRAIASNRPLRLEAAADIPIIPMFDVVSNAGTPIRGDKDLTMEYVLAATIRAWRDVLGKEVSAVDNPIIDGALYRSIDRVARLLCAQFPGSISVGDIYSASTIEEQARKVYEASCRGWVDPARRRAEAKRNALGPKQARQEK